MVKNIYKQPTHVHLFSSFDDTFTSISSKHDFYSHKKKSDHWFLYDWNDIFHVFISCSLKKYFIASPYESFAHELFGCTFCYIFNYDRYDGNVPFIKVRWTIFAILCFKYLLHSFYGRLRKNIIIAQTFYI